MSDPYEESPVNPIPPLVLALAGAIVAVEFIFQLGSRGMAGGPEAVGWRAEMIQSYGFSNRAQTWMLETGTPRPDFLLRYLTYPFLHYSIIHALFAGVMVLAIGKFVSERLSQWKVVAVFFFSAAFGAFVYGLVYPDGPGMIGAYPAVYGLIGAFTLLLWLYLGAMGEAQVRAFFLIGFLMAFQLFMGLLYEDGNQWIADLTGFAAGFALTAALVPGAWSVLMRRVSGR